MRIFNGLVLTLLLAVGPLPSLEAKSYSSGGRSYSSHSSSHSSHSGSSSHSSSSRSTSSTRSSSHSTGSSRPSSSGTSSSKSSGSTSTRSSSSSSGSAGKSSSPPPARSASSSDRGTTKTYQSGSGKSYSSGSTWNDDSRRSYTSGKSYTSPSSSFEPPKRNPSESVSSTFSLDSAAARARKEEASRKEFARFQESQLPKPSATEPARPTEPPPSYRAQPPPIPRAERRVYIPDTDVIVTRPARRHTVFYPYESRPVVIYRDSYSSLFWWWLMDRSIDERALWAYHHRYDMDPGRYQALVAENHELEQRVEQLETNQVPRDASYVPPGLDRDLMYSERAVEHAYSNRPTTGGRIAFGILAIPALIAFVCFFVWFIFFKRWPSSSTA